jgi:hypothetical protein
MKTNMVKSHIERKGCNKILYEQHIQRVKNSKSFIDTGPPKVYPYSNKWKIAYDMQNKKIEKENKLLSERLINSICDIDNELDTYIEDYAYFKRKMIIQKNMFDTNLINEQNKLLVKRLQNTKSCYNRKEWENDYQKRKQIIKNMSMFPDKY